MRRIVCAAMILAGCLAATALAVAPCPQPAVAELVGYLKNNHQSPEEYVIGKFTDHDVVILGEFHRIKHDQELIQRLIPLLHKNGVYTLGWEFARAADQPLIDSLLAAPVWDETQGRRILFQDGLWGYREYLDILKAAWAFNATLAKGQRPFRIIGVSCDWDFSLFKTQEDRDNPELRRQAFHGCTEANYADNILAQVKRGDKVLVHCGMHHAFTRYRQPVVDTMGNFIRFIPDTRMGEVLHQQLGARVFCICLHSPWYLKYIGTMFCRPVNGMIDSVMAVAGPSVYPCGFDVVGTPFGCLGDTASAYKAGYPDFTLADFCDGYIFQKPFGAYEVTAWIDDFVNEANVAEARANHYNLWYRDKKVEDFKTSMDRQIERELWWYRYLSGSIDK
jgi:hypothetical protein